MTQLLPWPSLLALSAALVAWSPAHAVAVRRSREIVGRGRARPPSQLPRRIRDLYDRERPSTGSAEAPGRGVAQAAGRVQPARTPGALRRRALAVAAGLAGALLFGGGVLGLGAAGAIAVLADRLLRRGTPDQAGDRSRALERELPAACDLLAVCLLSGVPVAGALAAVAAATAGPLGAELDAVAALYRLGAAPPRAWGDAAPELALLGRLVVRAGESGASVAPALQALAVDRRAAARSRTEAAVRRSGVFVLAPLGACFLPAFLCLGVVPLVLGIADKVFR